MKDNRGGNDTRHEIRRHPLYHWTHKRNERQQFAGKQVISLIVLVNHLSLS